MFNCGDPQQSFYSPSIYDYLVPSDHFLRRLKEAVDFSFVNDLVRDLYSEQMGRPSLPPVLMVKALLLQYFYNISDDALEEALTANLFFKYFCDMEWDARGPDATSLVRFRGRLGPERFVAIFNAVVEQAAMRGLVSDALSVVDSTQVRAKVDMLRVRCRGKRNPDPDSRDGYKVPRKPFHGYKAHLAMDAGSQIITRMVITPGNVHDGRILPEVLDSHASLITADKAYDTNANLRLLHRLGIESAIIPRGDRSSQELWKHNRRQRVQTAIMRRRTIEPKVQELKNYHGLSRCRYWGLAKTTIQALLTALAVNLKRMVKLLYEPPRRRRRYNYYIPWYRRKLVTIGP